MKIESYQIFFMENTKSYIRFLATAYLIFISVTGLRAQTGSALFNQAEDLFKAKNYYEASVVFEKYLITEKKSRPRSTPFAVEKKVKGKINKDPHQEAVYQLAESYRKINNYQKAEKYYKEAVGFSDKAYPAARYWYAVTLRANQKYSDALQQINIFLEKHTEMDELLIGADREMEDLKFIQAQSERVNDLYALEKMEGKEPEFGYALAQRTDDRVVFTAVRADKSPGKTTQFTNALYESLHPDNPLMDALPMSIQTGTGVHDGMATFSHDGKTMFFTRWTKNNDQTISLVYISRFKDSSWSLPVKAPEPINEEGYNTAQPCITTDGRYLVFSSDRPGGFGGYDLWACALDSGMEPILVRNLGNIINSGGDDEAPYFHDKTRTLVFSSNGRIGMGGFDIFYAKGNFNLTGWEKPENPGAPLNSSKDDLYYVSTDEDDLWNTGWISSDRSSECCLALFAVRGKNAQYVNGSVVDCKTRQPLPHAILTVTDLRHHGHVLGRYTSDTSGRYAIELHNSPRFKISASMEEYEPSSIDFNLKTQPGGNDSLNNQIICLNKITYPEKEINELLKSLERSSHLGNFAYKKAVLNPFMYENLDSLSKMLKKFPNIIIRVEGYTDGIGGIKYNIALAQRRVDACIRYLKSQGVPAKQMIGKAMGKCCPIAPETIDGKDNPAGREVNRRVEYKVIKH